MNVEILGISDVQWPDSGECSVDDYHIYYSGGNDPHHRYGVGIIVSKEINQTVMNVVNLSNRVMLLQLKSSSGRINIIQVYAPTADKGEHEIKEFYGQLDSILKVTNSSDSTIILGDFNAKVGEGRVEECVGPCALGERNDRGELLIEFAQENKMTIANTWFKLPKRRLIHGQLQVTQTTT